MLSIKTIAGALASLAFFQGASAYISSVTPPSTGVIGSTIPVAIETSLYIQQEVDFGIIWGLYNFGAVCDDCIGEQIDFSNI